MSDKEIDKYYTLKSKYEKSIMKDKKNILENKNLNNKEKRILYNKIEKKCIICKGIGGSIFENKNNKLTAICGARKQCKLNINIDKTNHFNVRDEDIKLFKKIKKLKSDIVAVKLDILYKYDKQDTLLEKFEEIKKELFITTKYLLNIRKEYLNIINNSERTTKLNESLKEYYEIIKEIKELGKLYNDNESAGIVKTMIEKQFMELQPLVKNIRENKYLYSEIIVEKKTIGLGDKVELYKIEQLPYSITDLFIPVI